MLLVLRLMLERMGILMLVERDGAGEWRGRGWSMLLLLRLRR